MRPVKWRVSDCIAVEISEGEDGDFTVLNIFDGEDHVRMDPHIADECPVNLIKALLAANQALGNGWPDLSEYGYQRAEVEVTAEKAAGGYG